MEKNNLKCYVFGKINCPFLIKVIKFLEKNKVNYKVNTDEILLKKVKKYFNNDTSPITILKIKTQDGSKKYKIFKKTKRFLF